MPTWFLLRCLSDVCAGLQYAHDLLDAQGQPVGLVHRDISPENIMLSFTGTTKLLDFGVAKANAAGNSATKPGALLGKFCYMAPERVQGQRADRRSDIYALGVILYEFLAGVRPFSGQDEYALLAQIAEGKPRDPREIAPKLPDDLVKLVMTAMAREVDARYAEASALGKDLQRYLRLHHASDLQSSLAHELSAWFSDAAEIPSDVKKSLSANRERPLQSARRTPTASLGRRAVAKKAVSERAHASDGERDFDLDIVVEEQLKSVANGGSAPSFPAPEAEVIRLPIPARRGGRGNLRALEREAAPLAAAPAPPTTSGNDPSDERTYLATPQQVWRETAAARPARREDAPAELTPWVDPPIRSRVSTDVFAVHRSSNETLFTDVFTAYRRPRPPAGSGVFAAPPAPRAPTTPFAPPPPSAPTFAPGPSTPAAVHFERGLAALRERDYARAQREWETVLEHEPDHRSARTNLVRLQRLRGNQP
jgi:hypothetical protein